VTVKNKNKIIPFNKLVLTTTSNSRSFEVSSSDPCAANSTLNFFTQLRYKTAI